MFEWRKFSIYFPSKTNFAALKCHRHLYFHFKRFVIRARMFARTISPLAAAKVLRRLVSNSVLPADSSIKEANSSASPRGRTSDVVIDNRKFSGLMFTLIVRLISLPRLYRTSLFCLISLLAHTTEPSLIYGERRAFNSLRMAIYEQLFAHTGNMAESFVTVNLNVNLDARHCSREVE